MSKRKDYVLGADEVEIQRLKLQHDLWRNDLIRIWEKSLFSQGQKFLELGCGPGFTTRDLSLFLKSNAKITAVDISDNFLKHLDSMKIPGVKTVNSFIEKLDLPNKDYDAAFCRWLMIFVPNIDLAIKKIGEHLKPNSVFSMQEYISYDSFSLAPDEPIMKVVVDAIFKSWMDQGGYPNQGRKLPQVLEKNGFQVLEIEPIARVCRPEDDLWQWPETFFQSFLPRLIKTNYLKANQAKQFWTVWEKAKRTKGSFCVAPTVVNIIARKK